VIEKEPEAGERQQHEFRMPVRKQHQITMEQAWRFYFPERPLPPRVHFANMLNAAANNIHVVLDTMESASTMRLFSPAWWIFSQLRKYEASHGGHQPVRPIRRTPVAA